MVGKEDIFCNFSSEDLFFLQEDLLTKMILQVVSLWIPKKEPESSKILQPYLGFGGVWISRFTYTGGIKQCERYGDFDGNPLF